MAAKPSFGSDLARDARHLRGESVQLIDHRIDCVFQLEDLAADIDGDLARQVAARDRSRHVGDIADLISQIAAHRIDRVGQVLPCAGHAGDQRLSPELPLGADFARNTRHFARRKNAAGRPSC